MKHQVIIEWCNSHSKANDHKSIERLTAKLCRYVGNNTKGDFLAIIKYITSRFNSPWIDINNIQVTSIYFTFLSVHLSGVLFKQN